MFPPRRWHLRNGEGTAPSEQEKKKHPQSFIFTYMTKLTIILFLLLLEVIIMDISNKNKTTTDVKIDYTPKTIAWYDKTLFLLLIVGVAAIVWGWLHITHR